MANKSVKRYPFKFDNTIIPFFPSKWDDEEPPIENTLQSEGGTDMIEQVRSKKYSADLSFKIADRTWVAFFKSYQRRASFQFSYYEVETDGYAVVTAILRDFKKSLVQDSEDLTAVSGVWECSFTVREL